MSRWSVVYELEGVPVAQPRATQLWNDKGLKPTRVGFIPKEHAIHGYKLALRARALELKPARFPMDLAISVVLQFIFPRNKSCPFDCTGRVEHLIKPDIDNLSKSVLDSLKGVFWKDDCQVCSLTAHKCYASLNETPRTVVRITSMSYPENS